MTTTKTITLTATVACTNDAGATAIATELMSAMLSAANAPLAICGSTTTLAGVIS